MNLRRAQDYNLAGLIAVAVNDPSKLPTPEKYLGRQATADPAVTEAKSQAALLALAARTAEAS